MLLAFFAAANATQYDDTGLTEPLSIINGEPADAELYPMSGALLVDGILEYSGTVYDFRVMMCSSTLIAPDVVALAAHCLDEVAYTYGQGDFTFTEVRWTRQADLTSLTNFEAREKAEWPADSIVASDWVTHPGFDMYTLSTGVSVNDDIALLFLDEPVLDVPYARLPVTEAEQALLVEGAAVDIVGWGQRSANDTSYGVKMWGASTVGEVGDYEVQIGPLRDEVRKCHGDSGGPTFQYVATDTMRLVGITSHAYDDTDCTRTGGVDTRVDAFLDWVDEEMRRRCEAGTRAWCEEEGIPTQDWTEEGDDTGTPDDDTGDIDPFADDDDDDDDDEESGGCGCASPVPPGWAGALLAVAVMRRRRHGGVSG